MQSFIRPTAGAIVFAASASNIVHVNTVLALIAGLWVFDCKPLQLRFTFLNKPALIF